MIAKLIHILIFYEQNHSTLDVHETIHHTQTPKIPRTFTYEKTSNWVFQTRDLQIFSQFIQIGRLEFQRKDIFISKMLVLIYFWPRLTTLTKIFAKFSIGKKTNVLQKLVI